MAAGFIDPNSSESERALDMPSEIIDIRFTLNLPELTSAAFDSRCQSLLIDHLQLVLELSDPLSSVHILASTDDLVVFLSITGVHSEEEAKQAVGEALQCTAPLRANLPSNGCSLGVLNA